MPPREQRPRVLRFGTFELDLTNEELRKAGALMKLQAQHFQLLVLLAERSGAVVTREEIRQALWDDRTFVDFDRSINFCINQIRGALDDDPQTPRYIETLPRKGYRFIAPVVRENPAGSTPQLSLAPTNGLPAPIEQPPSPPAPPAPVRSRLLRISISAGLALLAAGSAWRVWRPSRPAAAPLIRLNVDLGRDAVSGWKTSSAIASLVGAQVLSTAVAISHDGTRIVFPVRSPGGNRQLATRLLDQTEITPLPGTENGRDAFFSPDDQWIGFFASNTMRKISILGGEAVDLCAAPTGIGASWGEDGNIAASLSLIDGLSRVPGSGGAPHPLTKPAPGEAVHRWPQILPGGRAVLFTASPSSWSFENATIEAVDLQTHKTKILLRGGYFGRYLPSGHLVYVHQGVLFGVRFDLDRLEIRGAPVRILEDVAGNWRTGGGQLDFSSTGIFVYLAGKDVSPRWPIVWLDDSGKTQPLLSTPGIYDTPHLSPDGQRLALINNGDVSVYNTRTDVMTRLTFTGQEEEPVWSPDGSHLAFWSISGDRSVIAWMRADRAGETQILLDTGKRPVPFSFSPDGKRLAYIDMGADTGYDLWTLPLDLSDPDHPKPGKPEAFLHTPFNETVPVFSPDGRWIAYRSNESGTNEIYVRPFPSDPSGSGVKWQISTRGAHYVLWSNNRREMFYQALDNRIMVLNYTVSGDSFIPGKPHLWSDAQIYYPGLINFSLAPDGKRFAVFPVPPPADQDKDPGRVTFLLNFFDELRRRLPVRD